jgi:hypothetical protein
MKNSSTGRDKKARHAGEHHAIPIISNANPQKISPTIGAAL